MMIKMDKATVEEVRNDLTVLMAMRDRLQDKFDKENVRLQDLQSEVKALDDDVTALWDALHEVKLSIHSASEFLESIRL